MADNWQINKSSGECAGTGKSLGPGESFYATLVDLGDHFERRDYSVEYWETHQPESFSFWRTRIAEPNAKKRLFVDDDILIQFFKRLEDEAEALKVHFRFVLALILMRKRLLKYEDTRYKDGVEVWQMRFVKEEAIHEVVNPHLNDEAIERVSQELQHILQGDLAT